MQGWHGPRQALKVVLVLALGAKALSGQEAGARRPNIVLILTDGQGWGDIRSHGNDEIDKTLAAARTVMTQKL